MSPDNSSIQNTSQILHHVISAYKQFELVWLYSDKENAEVRTYKKKKKNLKFCQLIKQVVRCALANNGSLQTL